MKTVKLSNPITINDVEVKELTLKEPNVGNLEKAMVHQDNPMALSICLIAQISNHTEDDIRKLSMSDMNSIQKEMGDWLNF